MLLRPRSGVIEPAEVSATSYFSEKEIERARAFRRPNLALFAASVAVDVAVLALLVRRPPAALTATGRPLARAAAAGAGLTVALTAAGLPTAAALRRRSLRVGLATQSWRGWAVDQLKALGIGGVLSAAAAALFVALVRRLPRAWWAPAAAGSVGLSAGFLFVGPVLLDPIFNTFTPLPEGRDARERARAGREGGGERGAGLRGGRLTAHDGRQRLRHRPGRDQAGGALRHAAARLHPRRGRPRRRARARPRAPPRRAARAVVRARRRARGGARRRSGSASAWRPPGARRRRPRCRPPRWPGRGSAAVATVGQPAVAGDRGAAPTPTRSR